ncbi:hypothetical protein SPI_03744 [Niveomyces insectorum RCEF 264]|uniref:Uncharacterized protein n=1 Tax=Niveomyces insectorum RCEF 264 TaxID=1081102 RepID=A0A167WBK5_9HYPO|nr:hypothetical protein SPI_03744 [Niveomyces insectorum RCEF 264]
MPDFLTGFATAWQMAVATFNATFNYLTWRRGKKATKNDMEMGDKPDIASALKDLAAQVKALVDAMEAKDKAEAKNLRNQVDVLNAAVEELEKRIGPSSGGGESSDTPGVPGPSTPPPRPPSVATAPGQGSATPRQSTFTASSGGGGGGSGGGPASDSDGSGARSFPPHVTGLHRSRLDSSGDSPGFGGRSSSSDNNGDTSGSSIFGDSGNENNVVRAEGAPATLRRRFKKFGSRGSLRRLFPTGDSKND